MNVAKNSRLVAVASLPLAMFILVPARAGETIVGRVHDRSGNDVQVCFDASAAVADGSEYRVVRHAIAAPAKSPTAVRSQNVGTIRIARTGDDHCARATLVAGEARALDWVETSTR